MSMFEEMKEAAENMTESVKKNSGHTHVQTREYAENIGTATLVAMLSQISLR
jgi:hypothetical protein